MSEALVALQSGQVRALVGDNGVVSSFVRSHPSAALFTIEDTASFMPEHYGFAVKQGRKDLLAKINSGLAAVRADGTYQSLFKKYFGDSK
jgi:polar amino acid transport system substrate-binding protein